MAQDKEFYIKIGGIKESIDNLSTLEEALSSIEKKVNTVNSNGGFTVASKESNKAMDELGKLTQKITQYDKEYQMAVEASKGVLKDKNQEVKQAIELEKANIVVQNGAKSTYAEKQQLLSALGKVIKNTNAETEEEIQKQNELKTQYAALNQELKDFDASLGNHQRNVGDYGQATKNLKQELREFQLEMANMLDNGVSKADPQFVELAKKAGALKDAMADAGEEINRFASDTKKIDNVINIAQSATAAFELYKGTMSAFGLETEAAEEAIQKLMGAMSIIQSLQTLSETLQNGSATAKLFNAALKVTGAELVTTQLASIKATVAQEGLSAAQKAGAVASKTLGLAMKAIPLMFIIGLVATLITHWEDIVGWFERTFPVLNKLGGAFNVIKGVVVGLGKAVLNWLVNPFETFANVMKHIFAGDFEGALKAAAEGVKKQFKGTADAFKSGFQDQVERGMEDMSRKAAAEMDKTLTHQKNMITKQKNADGTYRREYIEANKKMFANRKKMYKQDSDDYRKVLEDEAAFNQQIEDAKETAAKKSAAERAKAAKEAADAAKKAAQETKQAIKEAEEEWKHYTDVSHEYTNTILDEQALTLKAEERLQKRRLESYSSGPIERYVVELQKLNKIQSQIDDIERAKQIGDISKGLADNIKYLDKNTEAWKGFEKAQYEAIKNSALKAGKSLEDAEKYALVSSANIENVWTQMFNQMLKMSDEERYVLLDSLGYNKQIQEELDNLSNARTEKEKAEVKKRLNILKTEQTRILNSWQKINGMLIKAEDENNGKMIDSQNKSLDVMKNELNDYANDAERSYQWLMKRIKNINVEPVAKDNIWGKLFGVVDEKETLDKYERIRKMWARAYNEIQTALKKAEGQWDVYLNNIATIYGQDSIQYKKAIQEKMDALEKLRKKAFEVGKVANAPTSLNGDYNSDGKSDTPSGGTTADGGSIQKGLGKFNEFFGKINDTLLAPAMDTFSMFMDFAIEETAQRLEQVQEMHDKALDKVNESADKIKELNEALKDSGNDNMDATKQQLADEQLLYAQRLAEEKKLAEEEKNLKNKQAQQEANARKMELRYQLVMGIANTAQGASKALAQWGWPLGAIFAGIMTALGLVQTALIAKQISQIKPVKYAEGGVINGKSHAQGGVPVGNTGIEVEGGEMVVSKKNTVKYIDVLTKINRDDPSVRYLRGGNMQYADTRIRKFANGGQLNFKAADDNLRANSETNRLMGAINDIDMSPVVSVVDIWKAENRLTKVRGLAGRE
jgi:hypothetical protein